MICNERYKDVLISNWLYGWLIERFPDGICYDYKGKLCEAETVHHKNVKFINSLITTFSDLSKEIDRSQPHIEIKVKKISPPLI